MKFTKQEICHTRQVNYGLYGLEKANSMTLPEVKLLAENPYLGLKIGYFSKVKGLLVQKTWKQIHKKFGIQSETSLLISLRKLSSVSI